MAIDQTDLVERTPATPQGGFAAVVHAHWSAVFRLLFSMAGNLHDAEELTQETFLRALRRLDTFRPGTQMRCWLLRIATNACLDLRRKQNRGKRVPLQDDLPDSGPYPGYRLETAEQAELLQAAMQELSETTRTVFHLRVQESLSFREIAELIGTTEQAARWHMHQARSKLLKRMKAHRRRVSAGD